MFKSFGSIGNLFGPSGPQLNYEIGEQYTRAFGSWTHYRGTSKVSGAIRATPHPPTPSTSHHLPHHTGLYPSVVQSCSSTTKTRKVPRAAAHHYSIIPHSRIIRPLPLARGDVTRTPFIPLPSAA